jgi:hypothetical protein
MSYDIIMQRKPTNGDNGTMHDEIMKGQCYVRNVAVLMPVVTIR